MGRGGHRRRGGMGRRCIGRATAGSTIRSEPRIFQAGPAGGELFTPWRRGLCQRSGHPSSDVRGRAGMGGVERAEEIFQCDPQFVVAHRVEQGVGARGFAASRSAMVWRASRIATSSHGSTSGRPRIRSRGGRQREKLIAGLGRAHTPGGLRHSYQRWSRYPLERLSTALETGQ